MKSSEFGTTGRDEQDPTARLGEHLVELQVDPEVAGPVTVLARALAQMTEGDARRAVVEALSREPATLSAAELGPLLNGQLDPEAAGRIGGMTQELDRLAGDNVEVRRVLVASLEEPGVENAEEDSAEEPRHEKTEWAPEPENPSSPLESRLREAGLNAEQAAQLQALAEEAARIAGGNEEVLNSMAEFFVTQHATAHGDVSSAPTAEQPPVETPPKDIPPSEPPIAHEVHNKTWEKEFSPEHLVRAAAAYSLEMWSADWGWRGAGPKASKGITESVLNREKTNRARTIMYGMVPEYFDIATLLEKSGIAKEWLGYDHLEKGEGVIIQLDEQNGKPKQEGEKDTSDSTFLLAFVSAHYKKPNGRPSEDEVSLLCTLPHEEATAVRKNPNLLVQMVPLLDGVPERYKNLADDLTIKERLNLEPEDLPLLAEKIATARSGRNDSRWRYDQDRARKYIFRQRIAPAGT